MELFRFLATVPGRLLAALLGVTVLPIRFVLNSIVQIIVAGIIGLIIAIAAPIGFALFLSGEGVSNSSNFLINALVIVPLIALISSVATIAIAGYTLYSTAYNVTRYAYIGFTVGLSKGLDGFIEAYRDQPSLITTLFMGISAFLNRRRVSEEQRVDNMDFDGFQQIVGELIDVAVPAREHDVPDMQVADGEDNAAAMTLLTPEELEKADLLIQNNKKFKNPLSLQIKTDFELLKTRLDQYNDLSKRLTAVKENLRTNKLDEIKDELIPGLDVEKPIFFFKQYEEHGQWHSVPAYGHVTNQDSLLTWLKTKPTHPLNRDIVKDPSQYEGKHTRYQWHELTVDNCSVQELREGANQIRDLISKLEVANKTTVSMGASPHFFSAQLPDEQTDQENTKTFSLG